jgi:T-complex protein 1 subunit theta
LEILPTLTCYEIKDYRNEAEVKKSIKTSVMSKQYGNENFLTKLIAKACGECVSM